MIELQPAKRPLVLYAVEWVDSLGISDQWEFREELGDMEPVSCYSCGFLEELTDTKIVLAMTIGGSQVLGRLCIPRQAIVRMDSMQTKEPLP